MTQPLRLLLGIAAVAGISFWLIGFESCHRAGVAKAEAKASEAKGRADVHAEAGAAAGTQAEQARQRAAAAEANVARLMAELEHIKRAPKPAPKPEPSGTPAMPSPTAPAVDLAPVVAKQMEIITAQAVQIQSQKDENAALRTEAGEFRLAFKAERDRSLGLEIALAAQKSMTQGALWRGRFQGIAVGFGAGYIAGKLR